MDSVHQRSRDQTACSVQSDLDPQKFLVSSTVGKELKHLQKTINVAVIWTYVRETAENLVGKGENADCQYFLLFL